MTNAASKHERLESVPPVQAIADFDAFFRREFGSVVALAYALSGSRLAAEDLAQDAFVAAEQKWEMISGYDKPGAWVRRVVANRSVSFLRRRGAEMRAIARLRPRGHTVARLPSDTADVWRAVRKLPDRQAQVVALTYLEDLGIAEIGEVLGIGAETVRTHLRRAQEALEHTLADRRTDHEEAT